MNLWKIRERPQFFSRRWIVVWVKRLLTAADLINIILRRKLFILRGAHIGDASIVYGPKIKVGIRNLNIGHHTFIAKSVHIAAHESVQIGSFVCINDGVRILTASHSTKDIDWKLVKGPIVIGDHAWIATDAIILQGVNIGEGAVVGAGAVITKDIPAFAIAVGNPAIILDNKRNPGLNYDPVILCAPYEAWIGRNATAN